ncbi:unnamed protein product, partial [Ectocarpus sp. 6 AP-2014]
RLLPRTISSSSSSSQYHPHQGISRAPRHAIIGASISPKPFMLACCHGFQHQPRTLSRYHRPRPQQHNLPHSEHLASLHRFGALLRDRRRSAEAALAAPVR